MIETPHTIIGRSTLIAVGDVKDIPSKVDTGADSSSIWASNFKVVGDRLHFDLFGEGSKLFPLVPMSTTAFDRVSVVSSNGDREERYRVEFTIQVDGEVFSNVLFTLADRRTMIFPVLLGRRFLNEKFVVDTSKELPSKIITDLRHDRDGRIGKSGLH